MGTGLEGKYIIRDNKKLRRSAANFLDRCREYQARGQGVLREGSERRDS